MSYEEAIKSCEEAIRETNRAIEENQEAIRQTKIELKNTVREQIEANKELERSMLDGRVSLENEVLDAIKARYQSEWNLMEESLNKQKEFLEQEKSLLDERVNARRNAEDMMEKVEEKAELERQLALVEMDSSRTKDAATLREQIAELNKEITRATEDELIESQQKMLDDEIAAIDDTITSGQEELEVFLNDANNFSEELNAVLEMSQEDLLAWLSENVEAFMISTQAAQQQMLNSWTDTYEQYKNIVDMYEDEINSIISSKDRFINFMKEFNQDYINGNEETRASLEYQWATQYEDYVSAYKNDNATFSHSDSWLNTGTSSSTTSNTKATTANTTAVENNTKASVELGAGIKDLLSKVSSVSDIISSYATSYGSGTGSKYTSNKLMATQYATGGLVDYTGLAWVDGTPSKPEYVLSANQWEDISKNINTHSFSYTPERISYDSGFDASSISMTNNIVINQASIADTMDITKLAEQVGEEFSKQLSINGFNTRFNI